MVEPADDAGTRRPERSETGFPSGRARVASVNGKRGPPHGGRPAMIDGARRVEFADVEVLAATDFVLRCRVEGKFVGVPALRVLPGTDVVRGGDRGHLVLPLELAEQLGLVAADAD